MNGPAYTISQPVLAAFLWMLMAPALFLRNSISPSSSSIWTAVSACHPSCALPHVSFSQNDLDWPLQGQDNKPWELTGQVQPLKSLPAHTQAWREDREKRLAVSAS